MGKYLLPFLMLFCLQVHAQDKPDTLEVNPDRPDVTNGTSTILPGYLQIEHGSFIQQQKMDDVTLTNYGFEDVAFRLGIVKKLEFSFHYLLAQEYTDSKTSATGFPSTNAGFKYSISDQHGILPSFAIGGGINLPFLASAAFKPQPTEYTGALLFQHEIGDWEIGYNFSFDKAIAAPVQWGYSISVRDNFSTKWSGYLEHYLYLQSGKAEASFDSGLGYEVTKLLMLDAAAATTVNQHLHYFTIGISYLIPKKLF